MSNEHDKFKTSKRRLKDTNAVNKQVKIAKAFGVPVKNPHKLSKRHALNCGNPRCMLCSNPRRTYKELTTQEKRIFQDLDRTSDRHSNGLKNPDD